MRLIKSIFVLCLLPFICQAKDISTDKIDEIVKNAMEVFSVPGLSIGVIQNGEVIHKKGYGILSLEHGGAVDEHSYFGIASNSKGFTATALALLVEDGKIKWDDPVKKHLSDFEMWDPYITNHFTVRDLLTHATGLPLGSGDLMWWPDANYSADEIIKKMKFLKPNRGFRTSYEYNNMPFIVAGAIIPAVTGKPYHEFLEERIFMPLDMDRCTANTPTMANDTNTASPHAIIDGTLKQLPRYLTINEIAGSVAAAGIQCSMDDLLKWEMMHINAGEGIMKKESHLALWQVNTPMSVSQIQTKRDKTHFRGYGLGYNLSDYHGIKVISHGGALIGMYSHISMIPERGFAIAITTNQQAGGANTIIKNEIINHILDIKNAESARELYDQSEENRLKEVVRLTNLSGNGQTALPFSEYAGTYKDPWWDNVEITLADKSLFFKSDRSPTLRGALEHFNANTFIVRWDDRNHEADAFVRFIQNETGIISSFTMKAISNRTDFSYDFHHVNMIKQ